MAGTAHTMIARRRLFLGVVVVCLLAALVTSAALAATPNGTQIAAVATAEYYSSAGALMPTVTSNTVTTTVNTTTGTYIRAWLMNGYYSNTNTSTRLSQDYLSGEATIKPTTGTVSGGNTWTSYTSSADIIDLNAAFGGAKTSCAGYAHVYVYSPSSQSVRLWLGSDNGIKVWLNGSVVETVDTGRGLTVDQDKLTVSLLAGWNRLLCKVSQYGGNWQLTAKVCDANGNAISGIQYSVTAPSGTVAAMAADTTPPDITGVNVVPTSTSATVTWNTDEASTTMVEYGPTADLGQNCSATAMVTSHSATIDSLTPNTNYTLKVGSTDASGNTTWDGDYTFTTSP